jgi:deoxyhypusine monooxygenase
MFSLRNMASSDLEAALILCEGFKQEEGALFKHEIAFVLGQLQIKETVECLSKVLIDKNEHAMVR